LARSLERIGLLGCGRMGTAMGGHVLDAGIPLAVFDPDAAACASLVGRGAVACADAGEVAERADLVLIVVVDDEQTRYRCEWCCIGEYRHSEARDRRSQAARGYAPRPGRAGRIPRLSAQEADREGDHDQERTRPQLPRGRAGDRPAASKRFPLHLLTTHEYGLGDADRAIRAVGGEVDDGVVHVSLLPWKG
jgi:hypothetical protein